MSGMPLCVKTFLNPSLIVVSMTGEIGEGQKDPIGEMPEGVEWPRLVIRFYIVEQVSEQNDELTYPGGSLSILLIYGLQLLEKVYTTLRCAYMGLVESRMWATLDILRMQRRPPEKQP